ncbi:glycosyltransferase family 2 protein [Dyadobacter flavalbus]|uniref:Glycosyltransferase family 2 protein n=1 Tax=Dyadobacter flavalbus TaxID=2579942 RepID=A0A5M8Q9K2_9BACT|nr:glycosyltransferase [Dyadobacter flavalbus]KAA6431530.1 glycosyltransferase family 2 protein [Dyadobacter flavalbus]
MEYHFPDTTLLITHYNRSGSLERLLATFEGLGCRFGDIVVSDDGSRPEHLDKVVAMKNRYAFRLITTPVNKGLGNNINKGQDAVKTPYTLYVQEDFQPSDIFPGHFQDALGFMQEDPAWDIVRFYAYFSYPTLKPFKKGFSEMVYTFWDMNHLKFYYYSDHPHLRRSNFLEKFGRYPEGIKGDLTEYKMAVSFLQKKGKGLFFNDFTRLFYQKNSSDEPSTMERPNWRLSSNPLIKLSRLLYLRYRWLKNSLDLVFMK